MVEGKPGEIAGLLGPTSAGVQDRLGLTQPIAVGEGCTEPEVSGDMRSPRAFAVLGDGGRPSSEGDRTVDETLGKRHHGQSLQSHTYRVIVAQALTDLHGLLRRVASVLDLPG